MDKIKEEIRQALSRGYCTERNGKKVLDPDLIEDMAVEVEKVLSGAEMPQKCPHCKKEIKSVDNSQ